MTQGGLQRSPGPTPFGGDPASLRVSQDPALGSAAQRSRHASVGTDPVSIAEIARMVADPRCGALVTFDGVVRDHDGGRGVSALDYSAHPIAVEVIQEVVRDVAARYEDVLLAAAHRVGPLQIGDSALACAVSAPHRKSAFAACDELVDEIKRRVPIWKHQRFVDGGDEWVGS